MGAKRRGGAEKAAGQGRKCVKVTENALKNHHLNPLSRFPKLGPMSQNQKVIPKKVRNSFIYFIHLFIF